MAITVDLVADMGEGFGAYTMGDDDALLDIVSSANIACGFHAGDPRVMDRTVRECSARGVGVGAHPSFPDLVGFGRRTMELSAEEVRTDILYQLGALSAFAAAHGTRVTHLCPHGRLGNLVITHPDYARAMAEAVHQFDPRIILFTQAGEVVPVAEELGLRIAMVGAVDRSYEDDGTLTPRSVPGAVLHDADEIVARTIRMVRDGIVVSRGGIELPITCDTVLVHGDEPDALALARRIRTELESAGITIAPIHRTLES